MITSVWVVHVYRKHTDVKINIGKPHLEWSQRPWRESCHASTTHCSLHNQQEAEKITLTISSVCMGFFYKILLISAFYSIMIKMLLFFWYKGGHFFSWGFYVLFVKKKRKISPCPIFSAQNHSLQPVRNCQQHQTLILLQWTFVQNNSPQFSLKT